MDGIGTLDAKIAEQRKAALEHRKALGLGEYTALKGVEVLYDRTVTYRLDNGKSVTMENCTIHVGATSAVLWIPTVPKATPISRRLGTFTVKKTGRELYEADVKKTPRYPDGGQRKTWDQLGEVEQWSWTRPAPCN